MTATKGKSKEVRIVEHGNKLLAIFPNATEKDPGTLYRKLRRLEAKAARLALQGCNVGFDSEEQADDLYKAVLGKVNKLLGNYVYHETVKVRTMNVPLFINRDPRGYQLKIRDDWMEKNNVKLERDWGGYGLLAPEIK